MRRPMLLIPIVLLAVAEYIWRKYCVKRGYDVRGMLASMGVALGQGLFRPLTGMVVLAIMTFVHGFAPVKFPVNSALTWLSGFFALEFVYYWFHRASHRVRWMWATHSVHHSAREMILPAAIRLGWTELFSGGWLFFSALALIGFPPLVVAVLLAANLLYQYPLHTEAIGRLGPLEWIFNTPSHHRAHHSRDQEWLDCNFGGTLIIFDRMFGSFRPEPTDRSLNYGLAHRPPTHNPFRIAFGEWIALARDLCYSRSWKERFAIALRPPG